MSGISFRLGDRSADCIRGAPGGRRRPRPLPRADGCLTRGSVGGGRVDAPPEAATGEVGVRTDPHLDTEVECRS
ncbi:hypothetical protein ASD51_13405 [Streptomyces sp. Root55]|nr:hypothetical protein ASD26_19490 [Streptomyces sp. Root1319]KQZ05399.1 hypothetical protein ASD51_13405 [Streptomyces sp. Root55]